MHGVCLRPGSSLVELRVRLYNRTPLTQTFLWWANLAVHVNEHYQRCASGRGCPLKIAFPCCLLLQMLCPGAAADLPCVWEAAVAAVRLAVYTKAHSSSDPCVLSGCLFCVTCGVPAASSPPMCAMWQTTQSVPCHTSQNARARTTGWTTGVGWGGVMGRCPSRVCRCVLLLGGDCGCSAAAKLGSVLHTTIGLPAAALP